MRESYISRKSRFVFVFVYVCVTALARLEIASFIKRNGSRDVDAGGVEIALNSASHWPWKWVLNGPGSHIVTFRLIFKTFFWLCVSFEKSKKKSLLNNLFKDFF